MSTFTDILFILRGAVSTHNFVYIFFYLNITTNIWVTYSFYDYNMQKEAKHIPIMVYVYRRSRNTVCALIYVCNIWPYRDFVVNSQSKICKMIYQAEFESIYDITLDGWIGFMFCYWYDYHVWAMMYSLVVQWIM